VNVLDNASNCGICGNACAFGSKCTAGTCVASSTGTGGSGNTGVGGAGVGTGGKTSATGGKSGSVGGGTAVAGGTSKGGATATGGGTSKGGATATGGGTSKGGATSSGGSSAKGGTTAKGGSTGTAGSGTGSTPAGWWTSWKSEGWHGCAWTAIGAESTAGTTISPKDFTSKPAADPYSVKGNVAKHADFKSVALLGFNLNQDPAGASCAYDPSTSTAEGPPGVTFASTYSGIAVNFSKLGTDTSFTLRIQLQTSKGNVAANVNDRWCQTITAANGKAFLPFNKFYTECWNDGVTGKLPGNAYNNEAISSIVFTVPGVAAKDIPYEFAVNGFALGNSAADAPEGGSTGSLSGTIGGPGGKEVDFQRVRVSKDGHDYVIQNNNWGNPDTTEQTLTYKDNSFVVTSSTGSARSDGAPSSFPSVYIGASGETANGLYSTHPGDGLPKLVSQLTSVQTTFKYNRCNTSQNYNATYDVWFSDKIPTSTYEDALSGFVMVWLCDPANYQPIGTNMGNVTIDGHTWQMWQGPRGGSRANSNAPVISYVATTSMLSYSFDLNVFIKHAVAQTGFNTIKSNWYLTDVFGGFEIWNGSGATGLAMEEFTCVVK
jgi:hypothetical protein